MKQTLGEFLKEKRLNKGQTQFEAARELGITQVAYSNIETNKAKPKISTLCKIADYTKKSVHWLRNNLR